jgi:hypothetical protein
LEQFMEDLFHGPLSLGVFCPAALELDPAGVEAIEHLNARRSASGRRALRFKRRLPLVPKHWHGHDWPTEHAGEGIRSIDL